MCFSGQNGNWQLPNWQQNMQRNPNANAGMQQAGMAQGGGNAPWNGSPQQMPSWGQMQWNNNMAGQQQQPQQWGQNQGNFTDNPMTGGQQPHFSADPSFAGMGNFTDNPMTGGGMPQQLPQQPQPGIFGNFTDNAMGQR